MVVDGWLARAASARADRLALSGAGASWTYAELHERARAGARDLAARGVRAEQRVAIVLAGGPAFAQALHACLLLGAVAQPIDMRSSASERDRLCEGAAARIEEPLAGGSIEESRAAFAADERRAGELALPAAAAGHELDAPAVLVHTSGTAATPRPVELSYGNFLWSALGSAVALGVAERERWLCALPVSHVGGLSILMRSAIYGTTAVVHERFELDAVLAALRGQDGEQITLVSLVATTLARLLDAGLRRPPSLRCALTGGGPVPAALVARARTAGVPVSLTYGLTEAASQVTTTPLVELCARDAPPDGAGRPLFCTRVRVEGGRREGDQSEGEIMVAGPTVARASLGRDGWLRTADVGSVDAAGRLRVSGRSAETIVSGGENVAPAEVEAVLEAHPDVLEAAVVGRPDERWGEAVTAIVVARAGRPLDGEALRAHCAVALARHKVPKQVLLVAGPLPRTRSGKLLRRELR